MKRQTFRLGSVLRHYEMQKQRTELDLQRASRTLQETDLEIGRLEYELATLAERLRDKGDIKTDVWLAGYRKTDQIGHALAAAHARRLQEAAAVAQLQESRRKWSVAEETLGSIQREIDTFNRAEGDKAQQEFVEENVLRKWMQNGPEIALDP